MQAKLAIAQACARHGVPLISCMGTGNKLEPERLQICDISKTRCCPPLRGSCAPSLKARHFLQGWCFRRGATQAAAALRTIRPQSHTGQRILVPGCGSACGAKYKVLDEHLFFQRRLRREVFALIHNRKAPSFRGGRGGVRPPDLRDGRTPFFQRRLRREKPAIVAGFKKKVNR